MTRNEARKIQSARNKWRLCCAAEIVFARLGANATVNDILKQANMSRRSFYEYYISRGGIIDAMTACHRGSCFGPHADWMILALNPGAKVDAKMAFDAARAALMRQPRTMPADVALLAWSAGLAIPLDALYGSAAAAEVSP